MNQQYNLQSRPYAGTRQGTLIETARLDVRADSENETVWLTQEEIAKLFGKARSTIAEHINHIFGENELNENTSVGFSDKRVSHINPKLYNLDVVFAVGYRVNSKRGSCGGNYLDC